MIRVIKTKPGDEHFGLFQNFPKEMYPPGWLRFNPEETVDEEILHACYLAMNEDKVCARAAVYNNPDLHYKDIQSLCIGNYEAKDDEAVSSALFSFIFEDVKQTGAEFMIGPMNGSTWNNYRLSLHHNHPNFFLEPYHHLYYNEQFSAAGFEVIARYFSSLDAHLDIDNPDLLVWETGFQNAGVTFRNINLDHYEEELKRLYEFNSLAFQKNFLYTPLSEEKFMVKYIPAKKMIDPQFVILAEDNTQNLVGYMFCINDWLNTKEKSLIVKTAARHPDARCRGLGHVMGNIIRRRAVAKGYTSIIHAFMYEQGTSTAMSERFHGEAYKRYVLYGKHI